MQILLTVKGDGPTRDVWVDAEASAPFASVSEALEPGTTQAWWDGERPLRQEGAAGDELLDGAVITHRPPPASGLHLLPPAVELLAVSGPHAGAVWPLPIGEHRVGRCDDASVNLVRDLEVSRQHAVLSVVAGEVRVRDDGSAHGVRLEGRPVTDTAVAEHAFIQVGSTILAWRAGERSHSSVVRNGEGGLVFNRPPRLAGPALNTTVHFPGPSPVPTGVNFPLMATIAPLLLGVILALAMGNPLFLLFTLLAPVIGVSNYFSQRRTGVKSHREKTKAHRSAVEMATAQLAEALRNETAQRRAASPDPATLAMVTDGPQTELWERRRADRDYMALRVGLSDRPADVTVENQMGGDGPPVVRMVPAVVELPREGVLGVAGERRTCEALVTGLLVQAAVLHSPEDLTVTILTGAHQRDAWSWARWLPHLRDRDGRVVARIGTDEASISRLAADLSAIVDDRLGGRSPTQGDDASGHLVIVDGAYQIGALPTVTKLLRRGPEAGIMSICIDDAERMLPEECRAVALCGTDRPALVRLRTGTGVAMDALADLVDTGVAETAARRLAPLRLNRRVTAGAAVPTSVRLLDQLGLDPPTPDAVLARWSGDGRSTAAVMGVCETGPMVLDLAKDGPHGLVAGTTGSGKSELLQSLIASLAVVNRPDQMNFVLVDYKGGSAFKECSRLVHTVGMVTDLDGHLTERALASIGAELRRREVLLGDVNAKDLEAYWRLAGPDRPVLGRLVIVIDEFASLVEELPSFVDGLIDLARRGRSLGIHLILATQRPAGVVSAAIKTNTNLRLAMRVTDAADSTDVIDSPLASRIPKSSPGRAYARVGHEDLTEFQAARIGGRRPGHGGPPARATTIGWGQLADPPGAPDGPSYDEDTTDLAVLVDAVNQAAERSRVPDPRRPWLPALPEQMALTGDTLEPSAADGPVPALFGVEDLPDQQAQRYATFDVVRDGHLLIIGDPGSGRSTLLRSITASLASRNRAADIHVYGIDCGNGALIPLESFPHVGAVVTRREADRVDRLITKLLTETTDRQQLLARNGFATIADQRQLSAPEERLPYIVVLLDRWEGFNAEFDTLDGGRLVTSLMHLMREGPGAGVRVIVTADRSGTTPRFSSLAERILMLRLNDRTVYSVVGLNPRHLPESIGPGRAFYARGGTEVQVGLLAADPSGPAQVAALDQLAARAARREQDLPEARRPDPIAVLPMHVSMSSLFEQLDSRTRPAGGQGPRALVGIGGDRLVPVEVDLGLAGPGFVISGPARSGRSTALISMARSAVRNGSRVVGVTTRTSPLRDLAGEEGVVAMVDGLTITADDLTAAIKDIGVRDLTVLVDDVDLLGDSPVSDVLSAFLRAARDNRSAMVVAGTSGELNQFRGVVPEAKKSKCGLLLCPPSTTEGDVLGVRLPRTALFGGPPGRGLLVSKGEITVVQVAVDDQAGHSVENAP
ncbi:MAG TPA: FtsK/SpoIIIE domain-containing protein [Acidimicrobiales bacterium]|jgi:S-DNA-T family DNA segregation ATPase FtsK/SpoIIIE|nr:FtsK/SpoIIIE domain-containing protein [Acidimicrobiales bacterium]